MTYTARASVGLEHRFSQQLRVQLNVYGQSTQDRLRSFNANAPLDGVFPDPEFERITEIESTGRGALGGLRLERATVAAGRQGLRASCAISTASRGTTPMARRRCRPTAAISTRSGDRRRGMCGIASSASSAWSCRRACARTRGATSRRARRTRFAPASTTTATRSSPTGPSGVAATPSAPPGSARSTCASAGVRSSGGGGSSTAARRRARRQARGRRRAGVEFYAQAWNILNETNFTRYSGVMTSPYFLQPTAAAPARRFDFGTRVFF